MTLARQETVDGLKTALGDFEDLLRSLGDDEAERPSRCAGWTATDVGRHVVGQLSDVVNGRFDNLGTPGATQREVDERAGRAPKELADELAELRGTATLILDAIDDASWAAEGPQGGGTLGSGVESLWFDAWLHADDIRAAIGQPSVGGPGVRASLSHLSEMLTTRGWGPATLALDGQDEFAVSGGGGQRVTGDPIAFILAATGRADAAPLGLDAAVNVYG
jgi:uncharacterized protein (TIGR03083 family)